MYTCIIHIYIYIYISRNTVTYIIVRIHTYRRYNHMDVHEERQYSWQAIADFYINNEINIRNMLQALLSFSGVLHRAYAGIDMRVHGRLQRKRRRETLRFVCWRSKSRLGNASASR